MNYIVNNIFSVNEENFTEHALAAFHYQYKHNEVYKAWTDALQTHVESITRIEDIPFLPVSLFKKKRIISRNAEAEIIFESSGTTETISSKHYVKDKALYIQSCVAGFEMFYGPLSGWCIIALLPSYLERSGSSLVLMADEFIKMSRHPLGGFYLYDYRKLADNLAFLEKQGQKTLLIGVTYALLDFAEAFPMQLYNTIIMETGGMKGRRREMIRKEVHTILQENLEVSKVHSEYGMTELLSQAYSKGDGLFCPVPWMKVLVRDEEDPLTVSANGNGIINVIDLANIHSCCFIATDDAGLLYPNGSFEVLGRVDNSDIRGCSLMVV